MKKLTPKICAVCLTTFQPKRGEVQTCGLRRCANVLAHRNFPGRNQRPIPKKPCAECGVEFQPKYRSQACCTRSCGSARSMRRSQKRRDAIAFISRRGKEVRAAQVKAKVQGMTPEQAYEYGRRLERSSIWQRLIRQRVIDPRFVDRPVTRKPVKGAA